MRRDGHVGRSNNVWWNAHDWQPALSRCPHGFFIGNFYGYFLDASCDNSGWFLDDFRAGFVFRRIWHAWITTGQCSCASNHDCL